MVTIRISGVNENSQQEGVYLPFRVEKHTVSIWKRECKAAGFFLLSFITTARITQTQCAQTLRNKETLTQLLFLSSDLILCSILGH